MMDDVRNYFGFDLGDGESAVAWLREGSSAPPMMLEVAGRKNVLTALGESQGCGVLIGEQALLLNADQLYVRFKSRYLGERASASRLVRLFVARVLEELEKTGKLDAPSETAFFIGCPSGWPDEARATYKRLFEDAGFPNVSVISESRAAFLFARESGELGLPDESLSRPALVIDAGSSTTDFTYIHALQARAAFDYGENALGGGLIDHLLLTLNASRHPRSAQIAAIFEACPQYAARAELEARKVKEMYFTRRMQRAGDNYPLPCLSSVKIYYEDPPITLDISCSDEDMRAVLNQEVDALGGRSYMETYRAQLKQTKQSLYDAPPELILLTGGASRMDFMASLSCEAFPHARLVVGAEPEFAIARGLCYALRIDVRAERFMRDVKALIDSDAVERIVMDALPQLMRAMAPAMADELTLNSAPDAFARWKRGELKTVGDMSEAMRESLMRSLEQGALKEALADVTRGWIEEVRPALERETDPICAHAGLPLALLRLPSAAPDGVANLDIAKMQMIDVGLIQTVVDVVVAAVVAMLLGGGGVALLMAGPVGLLVSFMIGFVASRLGTTLARKHLDKFNMPQFMRTLFSRHMFKNALTERRGEIVASVDKQLSAMLVQSDASIDALKRSVSTAIEGQLSDMAMNARLMIH